MSAALKNKACASSLTYHPHAAITLGGWRCVSNATCLCQHSLHADTGAGADRQDPGFGGR
jgi:hypothetical protein